jgi:hypothetical protein
MNRIKIALNTIAVVGVLLLGSTFVQAQATRTWVSGVGDDANPCSRTAPCKTFAGAISKTAVCGEIDVLDPGGFGAVTITKCISIEADGVIAGVLVSGTNGIVVAAGPNDDVVIRGLTIEGIGTGINGIRLTSGGSLHVENCFINNFTGAGIDFEPNQATDSRLFVKDTTVRNNGGGGVLVKPAGGGIARAALDKVRLEKNAFGLRAEDNSRTTVRDSVSAHNTTNGFLAETSAVAAEINLESVVSAYNGTNGVKSEGGFSLVRLSNVTVVSNNTGLTTNLGGQFLSFFNNKVAGNTPGGDGVTPPTTPIK